jgi:hypothetical protein
VVNNLREISEYAGEHGQIIAMEATNRLRHTSSTLVNRGGEMIHDFGKSALNLDSADQTGRALRVICGREVSLRSLVS